MAKQNSRLKFIFMILLFSSLLRFSVNITYYPDKYKDNDMIFKSADSDDTYILKAGYFSGKTVSGGTKVVDPYLKNQGITLDKDTSCDNAETIPDITFQNQITDYAQLVKNSVYIKNAKEIKCQFFPKGFTSQNKNIKYKVLVSNVDTDPKTITVKIGQTEVCKDNAIPSRESLFLNIGITVTTDLNTYKVECGATKEVVTDLSTISFISNQQSSPALAFYFATAETNGPHTISGTQICSNTDNPCIEGFACVGGQCIECDESCGNCFDTSSSGCNTKCSQHSLTSAPKNGKCTINYVNIGMFQQINIDGIEPPRTNRLTLAFWFFIPKENPVLTITVDKNKFIELKIDSNGGTIGCTVDDLQKTSPAGFGQNNLALTGKWVFASCGMSYDHRKAFYFYSMNGDEEKKQVEKEINPTKLYDIGTTTNKEHFFRKFYRTGESTTITVNNAGNKDLYIKNLYLFKEYLLMQEYDIRYYNLEKFVGGLELPELLLTFPFDNIQKEGTSYYTLGKTYSGGSKTIKAYLSPKDKFNLRTSKPFRRLSTLDDPNVIYSSSDLISTEKVKLEGGELYVFDKNKPFSCETGYFLELSNTGSLKCDKSCNKYTILPGISDSKGICNYECPTNAICPLSNLDLLDFKNKFKCKNNFFQLYYHCYSNQDDEKTGFYYSSLYNPGPIIFDLSNFNLKSYFVEVWFYPDFFSTRGFSMDGNEDVYVFATDSLYLLGKKNKYTFKTTKIASSIDVTLNAYEWNHLIFCVNYYKEENYSKMFIVFNNDSSSKADNKAIKVLYEVPLKKIYFCDNDSNCEGNTFKWGSGVYKNLRIWNGDQAQFSVTNLYDELYKNDKRMMSIVKHYPLYGHYIESNKLYEYNSQSAPFYIPDSSNPWELRRYNYVVDFDFIENESKTGETPTTKPSSYETCGANCERCFSAGNCYRCKQDTYLKNNPKTGNGECGKGSNYVLKTPTTEHKFDILDGINDASGKTLTLWIKLFGFIEGNTEMINLSDNLRIVYNENKDTEYFGLNLQFYGVGNPITIANDKNFRENFGAWTFISIALYSDDSKSSHFPPLIRFEINYDNFPLIGTLNPSIKIKHISFSTKMYALIKNVEIYDTFIIGAIANVPNSSVATATKKYFEPKTSQNLCTEGTPSVTYACTPDETNFNFENINCHNSCGGLCYGSNDEKKCSCRFDLQANSDKFYGMFLKTDSSFYCKNFDLVNFALTEKIEATGISSTTTDKYTMHFWVFAYSYVAMQFGGIKVDWEGHNTIEVKKNKAQDGYDFICSIESTSSTLTFKIGEWNFLHCAVDNGGNKILYTSTYTESVKKYFPQKTAPYGTKLTITDESQNDWGVLFFRQIRLWSNALESVSFLSRIKINTLEKFNGLLHQWDPLIENGNKNIIRIPDKKTAIPLIVKERQANSRIGANIVEKVSENIIDTKDISYPQLMLCGEEGEYYDTKTLGCVPFSDLTGSDFKIDGISVSYSHTYGISFWFFAESAMGIEKPIKVDWSNHMHIEIVKNTDPTLYCFPQNYPPYSTEIGDQNKSSEEKKSSDKILNAESLSKTDFSGEWLYVSCSLEFYNRKYFLNEKEVKLKSEVVYEVTGGQQISADAPLRYFFSENEQKSSVLKVEVPAQKDKKKIYFRSLYLFHDHIPSKFNFQYMDLTKIPTESFPPLALAINFANFDYEAGGERRVKYVLYSLPNYLRDDSKNFPLPKPADKYLSSNFVFLPLCNPENNEKYNQNKNVCEEIINCDKNGLNAKLCMDENTPLVCKDNYYINIDGGISCKNKCPTSFFRTPGTLNSKGICSSDCFDSEFLKNCPNDASSLLTYSKTLQCKDSYPRIDYQCFDAISSDNKGALFYSNFNNPINANIKKSITLDTDNYMIEFWFMIDHKISNFFADDQKFYYLFAAEPHLFYSSGSKIYYRLKKESPIEITGFHQYEWNKFVISVEKENINIFVNFDFENPSKFKNPGGINEISISFCSSLEASPKCKTSNIPRDKQDKPFSWGSAYYNNIRIWRGEEKDSKNLLKTIQLFGVGTLTEIPENLLYYYPLTIGTLDNNVMKEIMKNENPIVAESTEKIAGDDEILLYNYCSTFDWGLLNEGKFVSSMNGGTIVPGECGEGCKRCYEENNNKNCYECKEGYILNFRECQDTRGYYYFQTPSASGNAEISLKTTQNTKDITVLESFTLTVWFKYQGITKSSNSKVRTILSLDSGTYLSYNSTDGEEKLTFRAPGISVGVGRNELDVPLYNHIGKWRQITISSYNSKSYPNIYPHMLSFTFGPIDANNNHQHITDRIEQGITIKQLNFGYEVIALFADLRIYNMFVQGPFGLSNTVEAEKNNDAILVFHLNLYAKGKNDCLTSSDLNTGLNILCTPDINPFMFAKETCTFNTRNFLTFKDQSEDELKCDNKCQDVCDYLCFEGTDKDCTCDLTKGTFWVYSDDTVAERTTNYCEKIPFIDYSNLHETSINVKVSKTMEYTIEFWVYIYSYKSNSNFKDINLRWNNHNRVHILNEGGTLRLRCYPLYNEDGKYTESRVMSITFEHWEYVRCGTDLLNKKYFLSSTAYSLSVAEKDFPDYTALTSTTFKIGRADDANENFGFIFLREIRLWQQYNYEYIKTQNIELSNFDELPGLLHYYKNIFTNNELKMTDEVTKEEKELVREREFLGYNIVTKKVDDLKAELPLCTMGEIYENGACTTQTVLPKCDFSGSAGNCIICNKNTKFIDIIDSGKCTDTCPDYYFENELINQCRICHTECFTCTGRRNDQCTSCTGSLYLYKKTIKGEATDNDDEGYCIPNCEKVGLTTSLTRNNLCVVFDADASLQNVDTLTPIDINHFDFIEAAVIGATTTGYSTKWSLDIDETNKINSELGFTDDLLQPTDSPFTGDVTNLKCTLDTKFFKLSHKYVFVLEISKLNNGSIVSIKKKWTLTMNSPPSNGYIKVIPPLALRDTTVIIASAYDFEDENTASDDLEYFFYYIEDGTQTKIDLSQAYSKFNEVYQIPTVRYYQQESTDLEVFVIVRDKYGAEVTASTRVKIVNKFSSALYDQVTLMSNYELLPGAVGLNYLARSEFLKSASANPYREVTPDKYYIIYENSLDGSVVTYTDPVCVDDYCNGNGDCGVIDTTISCNCDLGFVGKNCNVDKNAYSKIAFHYQEMFDRLYEIITLNNNIEEIEFKAMDNLFSSAATFFQDNTFFTVNFNKFISFLEGKYVSKIKDDPTKYIKFFDYQWDYYYNKESQQKISNQMSAGSPMRNYTLQLSQQKDYSTAFNDIIKNINKAAEFLVKTIKKDFEYITDNFRFYIKGIDQDFDEEDYFKDYPSEYRPYIYFMDCLIEKQKNINRNSFNFYMSLIDYRQNPFGYDSALYQNITSPYTVLRIIDLTGKEISLDKCSENEYVKIHTPFNSYVWLDYINFQKSLFDPKNYKRPDDPIFRDPIFINASGYVSDDTVESRIQEYYRHYNFTGLSYDLQKTQWTSKGITYVNYTSDKNYVVLNSDHLSSFTAMFVPNVVKFEVDGRFFYLKKWMIMKWWPNYESNYGFILFSIVMVLFIFGCIFFWFHDYSYFNQETLLDFLKREIIKVHLPYTDPEKVDINAMISKNTPGFNAEKRKAIRHMFDNVNLDSVSDENEDEDEEESGEKNNAYKNSEKVSDEKILNLNTSKHDTENDGGYNGNDVSDFNSDRGEETNKEDNSIKFQKYARTTGGTNASNTFGNLKRKNQKDNYFLNGDKTRPNLVSLKMFHTTSPNLVEGELEDVTNEDQDRAQQLEAYANLNIPMTQFIKFNLLARHLVLAPLLNISLFNPRWKKLFLLTTQCSIALILVSVFLTLDEKITGSNTGGMIKVGVITSLASNVIMYFLVFFFITSTYQRRRLFNLVLQGGQLIVIKTFEKIKKSNLCWGIIGGLINVIIIFCGFYISLTFVSVWKAQKTSFLISFILFIVFEFIIFEILIELFVGSLFYLRKRWMWIRNLGEWLNRVRCYRTLWP